MPEHLSSHSIPAGIGGTPARVTSPAPPVLLIPDRRPEMGGLIPLFSEKDQVKALAFTGRGLIYHDFRPNISDSATVVSQIKFPSLGFWGYVRTFSLLTDNSSNKSLVRPIYTTSPDENAVTLTTLPSDPLPYIENGVQTDRLNAFHTANGGVLINVPLDFLLPGPGYRLGVQIFNNAGVNVDFQWWFEVLEVISQKVG